MSLHRQYILISLLLLTVVGLQAQTIEDVLRVAHVELATGSEKLHFDNADISLGTISEDDGTIEGKFTMSNLGKTPLVITKVVSSCSCLVVDYPKQPLMPLQRSEMTFRYHPKGYPGRVLRKVFVYTNLSASKPTAVLKVSGYVEKSSDPTINYRYSMGDLYLKQIAVSFKDGRRVGVESIKCYNAGEKDLHLKAMAGFLPQGLSFSTEPEVIEAQGEGELIIRHDPNVWTSIGDAYKVIIDGLPGKPSQRSIDVKFEYKK